MLTETERLELITKTEARIVLLEAQYNESLEADSYGGPGGVSKKNVSLDIISKHLANERRNLRTLKGTGNKIAFGNPTD